MKSLLTLSGKMYKTYFIQTLQMLKQNKFISIISILGTALAIMMIMTIIVADKIKNISLSPESNRYRTLYIKHVVMDDGNGTMNSWPPKYNFVRDYLYKMEVPEVVSAVSLYWPDYTELSIVGREGVKGNLNSVLRMTDAAYWQVLSFSFIEGKAFTQEEFDSGIKSAVISESTSKKLFKGESAIGKTIEIDFFPYQVVGVVKDVSEAFKYAYGDIWIPYTSETNEDDLNDSEFFVMLLAKDKKDFSAIIEESKDVIRKYEANNAPWKLFINGPQNKELDSMQVMGLDQEMVDSRIKIAERKKVFILLVLLLVPAINLSGFSLSRIRKRMSEIGIRKAFGAKKYEILTQVLYENMITSLVGGIIGLLFSYLVVLWLKDWLLGISASSFVPLQALVSPSVFIGVFIVCLLFNLLSAGIPAYRASRMSIVNSINQNEE